MTKSFEKYLWDVAEQHSLDQWTDDGMAPAHMEIEITQTQEDVRIGGRAVAAELLRLAEEWCAINAYDSDKGACDEHTVDDSRGRVCSADELRGFLKTRIKGEK